MHPEIADVLAGRRRWCVVNAEALAVLETLPAGCVDAVVVDPPYSSGGQFRGDRQRSTREKYQSSDVIVEHANFDGDSRDQRSFGVWCALWLGSAMRATKPGGMCMMFTDWRQLPTATDAIQAGGWVWRGIVPWDKINARPQPDRFKAQAEYIVWGSNGPMEFDYETARYYDGVIRCNAPHADDREHSTQKPVEVMLKLVEVAPPGGVVLDCFGGSGTTGVAAVKLGRRAIIVESNPTHAETARRRIAEADTHLFNGGEP